MVSLRSILVLMWYIYCLWLGLETLIWHLVLLNLTLKLLLFLHRVCSIKKRHSRDGCSWLHLCSNFLDITSIELLLLATVNKFSKHVNCYNCLGCVVDTSECEYWWNRLRHQVQTSKARKRYTPTVHHRREAKKTTWVITIFFQLFSWRQRHYNVDLLLQCYVRLKLQPC